MFRYNFAMDYDTKLRYNIFRLWVKNGRIVMRKSVWEVSAEECKKQGKAPLREKEGKVLRIKTEYPFYLLILPAAIVVFLFNYLPMVGLLIAFKDWNAKLGVFGSAWTDMYGFGNFIRLFQTADMTKAIWNTFYFNVVSMVFNFTAPIILALLFTEIKNKYYKKVTQTISYLPHFLSIAAVTGIVNALLSEYGLINSLMYTLFGIEEGQKIMSEPSAFLPVYVLTEMWQTVGWGSIIYLAAICGINNDLYEAAEIDGAGRFKQVIFITIPGILPTICILLIMKMGTLFGSSFEMVYGLQNPTAWTQEVIATIVYKNGIGRGEYSLSTALSLLQGVIALILTFGANFISKKLSNISMW